jgi:hypothetical protein
MTDKEFDKRLRKIAETAKAQAEGPYTAQSDAVATPDRGGWRRGGTRMSVDKTIKAWGGFCEGQLDFGGWPLGNGGILPVAIAHNDVPH